MIITAVNYCGEGRGGLNHGDTEVLPKSHVGVGRVAAPTFVWIFDISFGFDNFYACCLAEAEFIVVIIIKRFPAFLIDVVWVVT